MELFPSLSFYSWMKFASLSPRPFLPGCKWTAFDFPCGSKYYCQILVASRLTTSNWDDVLWQFQASVSHLQRLSEAPLELLSSLWMYNFSFCLHLVPVVRAHFEKLGNALASEKSGLLSLICLLSKICTDNIQNILPRLKRDENLL